MDTKSRKSKAFKFWLCFFLGINIIGLCIIGGLAVLSSFELEMLGRDIKETQRFKHNMAVKFDTLARYITDRVETDNLHSSATAENSRIADMYLAELENEGENLIYFARNPKTNKVITNSAIDLGITTKGPISLPEEYDFYIYFNGEKFIGQKDGKPLDIYTDREYINTALRPYLESPNDYVVRSGDREIYYDIQDCQILLAVNKGIVGNPYGYSSLYDLQRQAGVVRWVLIGGFAVFAISVGLLILSIIKRRYIKEFEYMLGKILGKIFFEFKVPVLLIGSLIILLTVQHFFQLSLVYTVLLAIASFWLLYIIRIDFRTNGVGVFTNNIISALIRKYKEFENRHPLQKALLLRFYTLAGLEVLLVVLTIIFLLMMVANREGSLFIFSVVFMALGVYLFYRYLRRYTKTVDDLGKIIDQTERIRQGDTGTKLQLSPDRDLFSLAENLNTIQDGITEAVERSIKSERMKVELITNISHDLKTPLTSIISYVDLLMKEKELPLHVKDYIKILAQKSERLKILIQDLFDLSKVTSGEMEFEKKPIDLGKLIEQTLADLDDRISESQLKFKVNIPNSPVPIISDGNKLYRVFLNLFQNTLKYSLAGTRVYVDLVTDDKKATVTIKNIANYEMNFNEEEIIERFVRGDKARSSEGSGLGLAIAQSFTQSCGGDFDIEIDGDLFKVMLTFDIKSHKIIENDELK